MARPAPSLLAWIGAFGPPVAWALQHVAGYAVALADCPDHTAGPGWDVPVNTATLIIGTTAAVVTLLCGGAAFAAWRGARGGGGGGAPPGGGGGASFGA